MNALQRFFHGEHGASRSYLFSKVFLGLLALDAWMLMIGHAGRYGAAGFNAAHFEWLDALQPLPTNTLYIAVLLLAGLLAFALMLGGLSAWLLGVLCVLYTYSWAMSMLDSYQHHYFVSIVLVSLPFFPRATATQLHPLPRVEADSEGARKRHVQELERSASLERRGWAYAVLAALIFGLYAAADKEGRIFSVFALFAAALALVTWWVAPDRRVPPTRAVGFGFNLLGATVCILYVYTALAKMDGSWVAGHTIRAIAPAHKELSGLVEWAGVFGLSPERFWALFATAVIPQELFIGFAYLCAVARDQRPSRVLDRVCWAAFALSVALHVGAEVIGLEIGWFSSYMLLLAATYLLPLAVVDRLVVVLTWPARFLGKQADEWEKQAPGAMPAVLTLIGSAAVVAVVTQRLDLPGASHAGLIGAAALLALGLATVARGRDPRRWALSTAVAAGLMWLAISASPVRFDYYRYRAGDLERRGDLRGALAAYERGERYAPKGASRQSKIDRLRAQLRAQD